MSRIPLVNEIKERRRAKEKKKEEARRAKRGIVMTFYNIRNFDRFIEVVNSCEGAVDAVSPEGKHGGRIRRMEVEAAAEEDAARLVSYMMAG